jgi:hypothetical protein
VCSFFTPIFLNFFTVYWTTYLHQFSVALYTSSISSSLYYISLFHFFTFLLPKYASIEINLPIQQYISFGYSFDNFTRLVIPGPGLEAEFIFHTLACKSQCPGYLRLDRLLTMNPCAGEIRRKYKNWEFYII